MWKTTGISALFIAEVLLAPSSAQSTTTSSACPSLTPSYASPIVADGWEASLIVDGLKGPRSILFDSSGNLLVVESGHGVVNLAFNDNGGTCLTVASKKTLVNSTNLNHGLALSTDGKTLYASSVSSVFSWSYNATSPSAGSTNKTIITGMENGDHITRTLLMSQKQPGILVVSRGSNDNIDEGAGLLSSGRAQIKAFNVSNLTDTSPSYDYSTSGRLLGWGLRNSVGIAEEPQTGGIFSVENSADQVTRNGVDIHEDDPGEEMNFHGYLNGSTDQQGGNHGYPNCFAVWNTNIPDAGSLKVGDQFTMAPNSTFNDTTCATTRIPPRLTFQAHMAPLDIIFTPDGSQAFISFHGSWDRSTPVGHKVSIVEFANGSPVEAPDSTTALNDIFTNSNASECSNICLRPVGLAMDNKGRIFMSSDASGEIWVLVKSNSASSTGTPTSASAIPSSMATSTSSGTFSSTASSEAPQIWMRPGTRWFRSNLGHVLLLSILAIRFNL